MRQTVEFTVTGSQTIHCASCEHRIQKALRHIPGVHDVRASADTQQVVATIDDSRIAPEQLKSKLVELGYEIAPGA